MHKSKPSGCKARLVKAGTDMQRDETNVIQPSLEHSNVEAMRCRKFETNPAVKVQTSPVKAQACNEIVQM